MAYEWSALNDEGEIRLLVLKPGLPHEELDCDIMHVHLHDNPTYEAISYAWESEELPCTITCYDRTLRITENLFAALRSFRSPSSIRILWVDALCINQRDLIEKAEQVRLIGKIFKTAWRVCIWLGEAVSEDALAFSNIQYAVQHPGQHSVTGTLMRGNGHIIPEATDRLRACMAALFRRKYLSRLWVVQELAQATDAVVYCGPLSMPLEMFFSGLQQLMTEAWMTLLDDEVDYNAAANPASTTLALPSKGLRTLKTIKEFRNDLAGPDGDINLARLLAITRHCEVTDPRDRVFALLSLSDNNRLARPFTIDYTISATEMFARLAEWYYTTRGLGFMSFASAPSGPQVVQSPSWVPNWTDPETSRPLWDYTKQFKAGGSGPAQGFVSEGKVLNINGKPVDSIAGILEHPISIARLAAHNDDQRLQGLEAYAAFFDASKAMCQQLWRCEDFSTVQRERYWRTLVASTHYGGEPALESDGAALEGLDEFVHLSHEEPRARIVNAAMTAAEERRARAVSATVPATEEILTYPPPAVQEVDAMHEIVAKGRVFIMSKEKRTIGWAPYGTRADDLIVVFEGGEIPFVIRPVSESTFSLIGECYLDGVMFGEVWADTRFIEGFFKLV